MTDLYCLRVKRESAGKTFPFDRVYLAKNGEHGVFKKMFRYALILPVEENLKKLLLEHVTIEGGETHSFDRYDDAPAPNHEEWTATLESDEWVMAVPILPKFVASNLPRYLTAAGKYRLPSAANVGSRSISRRRRNTIHALAEPFPNLTYLQTPEQNIRPVCVACPRFIMHQNGHCRLGETICYTSLAVGMTNHFQEGLDVPAAPENHLLEEEA